MLEVGDRVKIVFSPRRKYEQLFVGQEGTIIHYVGHSPGLVVRFTNGQREPFYDDELEPLHKPRETPLLVDDLVNTLCMVWDHRYTDGDESGVAPGYTIRLTPVQCARIQAVLMRHQEEVGDA